MDPIRGGGALNETQAKQLLDFFLHQYANFGFGPMAVVSSESNKIIGVNGIKRLDDFEHPDLGFAFLKSEWRKGYAFETSQSVMRYASNDLCLQTLYAIVHPDNSPSIRLLKKLGFTFLKTGERHSLPICIYQHVDRIAKKV